MNRYLLIALIGITALSCGAPSEAPAKRPSLSAAKSTSSSWSGCPVTREDVAAATGMDTGKGHFKEATSSRPVTQCSYTVGSSGIVELYDAGGLMEGNYLSEIASGILPDGAKPQWQDAPSLGGSAKTACGAFKDPFLNSCLAVALHDSRAIVVMVSTGPSKSDADRTAAAITLAKISLKK
ncbi:MAG: hypothetical protein QOC81_2775 [Thermoanaerobaculia bacterium]|jgi:hypothetical protein|nr:hypothetical protein [Thermoanaerobaculia bacterium]